MARTMEIMARKDEVNGQREGQYRKTSLNFFCYLSYLHPHLYLKGHNKNLSNQESSDLNTHTSMYAMSL